MSERSGGACTRGHVLAVVGPTCVGKTALAEELALRHGGELVSADSMQVYRGMDIGTAKAPRVGSRVTQWCVDLVDPGTAYSAAMYQVDAREAIDAILSRGGLPVVVGGSGLYIRAALDDMRFPPGDAGSATRAHYETVLGSSGSTALHALLAARDAPSSVLIHPANARRVVRALEMLDAGGPTYSEQHAAFHKRTPIYEAVHIGLSMDRATLYARIGARVDRMLSDGLLDEVRGLLDAGFRQALTAPQAIGYKELVPVVEDDADALQAAEAIKRATRRYAKRQLTWFRADPRVRWLDVTTLSASAAVDAAEALIESVGDEGHRS